MRFEVKPTSDKCYAVIDKAYPRSNTPMYLKGCYPNMRKALKALVKIRKEHGIQ